MRSATSSCVQPRCLRRSRRDRVADPAETAALVDALPGHERPVWATAMYAGLRRGELRALRSENVDLATGVLRVELGWDDLVRADTAERTAQLVAA